MRQMAILAMGADFVNCARAILARLKTSVVLIHSFWGIDKPMPLLPNLRVIGYKLIV